MLLITGHRSEAFSLCEQSIRLDPNSGEAHWLLGVAYFYVDHLADAKREFEVSRALKPALPYAHEERDTLVRLGLQP